ncbi:hypothetical protein [Streptomyces sp. S07_1.15]|nr:hypothetical protein [Streptomyces sp. S07_1.15]
MHPRREQDAGHLRTGTRLLLDGLSIAVAGRAESAFPPSRDGN